MSNYLGVMANNSRTVVHLLRCFFTVCGDDVLALLNISSVYNNIVLLMTLLALALYWPLVTLLVWCTEALLVVMMILCILRISFTLVTTRMRKDMRVMTNNNSTVVDLLRCFMAVLGDNVLTLLHISSVYNCIIFLMTLLINLHMTRLLYMNTVFCVTMVLMVSICKVASFWSSLNTCSHCNNDQQVQHS